jgi:predicted phage-related endonuclease
MTEIDLTPDTPEWLEFKVDTLGASEGAAAMGMSRYVTPQDFLRFKRARGQIRLETTENMQLGHEYEGKIADLFTELTGHTLHTSKMFKKPYISWITCTPDRIAEEEGEKVYIEIKWKANGHLPENHPEIEHIVQVHHQMLVLGKRELVLVYGTRSLDRLRVFVVHRNPVLIQEMMKKYAIFRKHWLAEQEMPLPYTSTVHDWTEERILKTFHLERHSFFKPTLSSSSSIE